MGKESIRRRLRRRAENTGEMVNASLALGATPEEMADAIFSGLADLPDDVKRKLIEKWSKDRSKTTDTE